jgi:hypothetical protein
MTPVTQPTMGDLMRKGLDFAIETNPVARGLRSGAQLMSGASAAVRAAPTAVGEQVYNQPLPGHEEEPDSLLGRLASHAQMIASGNAGAVAPMGPVKAVSNPPDTVQHLTDAERMAMGTYGSDVVPEYRTRGRAELFAEEIGTRGLDMVAQMLTDPVNVASMGIRGIVGDLMAAAFSAEGVRIAAEVAADPRATPEDVTEAVLGAAVAAVPGAVRVVREPVGAAVRGFTRGYAQGQARRTAEAAAAHQGFAHAKPVSGQPAGPVAPSEALAPQGPRPPQGPTTQVPPVAVRPGGVSVGPVAPSPVPSPVAAAADPAALDHEIDATIAQIAGPEFIPVGSEPPPPARLQLPTQPQAESVVDRINGKMAAGEKVGTEDARQADAERRRVDAARPDEPPRTLNEEIDRTIADLTDTGEQQPRLPGAEGARQVGKADVTFKAPQQASGDDFSLTGEETPEAKAAREEAERGPDLFTPAPDMSEGYENLTIHERRELNRMLKEMETQEFTKHSFVDDIVGQGGSFEIVPGGAGAPVFSDVKAGTRQDVIKAIQRVLDGKKPTAVGIRAIDVARHRMRNTGYASSPTLPPNAGDEPGVTYVPITPNMTAEEYAAEKPFREALERRTAEMVQAYLDRFGNVVDADKFKELSPEYAASDETRAALNRAVHRTSSAGAFVVYKHLIEQPTPEGRRAEVDFIAGPTGAGKSTVQEALKDVLAQSQAVVDGPLSNYNNAVLRIQMALDRGLGVNITYIHRDPVDAWKAIQGRVRKPPVDYHIQSHVDGLRTIRELVDRYADEPNVTISFIRNATGVEPQDITVQDLPEAYNEEDVRAAIEALGTGQDAPAQEPRAGEAVAGDSRGREAGAESGVRQPSHGEDVSAPAPTPRSSTPVSPPAKPRDFFAEAGDRIAARKATAAALAKAGESVELSHPSGRSALAGPDMSKPGAFRVTRFDDDGPAGHSEHPTLEAAILEALEDGYVPKDAPPPAFTPVSTGDKPLQQELDEMAARRDYVRDELAKPDSPLSRMKTWVDANDPRGHLPLDELDAKLRDVAGRYLNQRERDYFGLDDEEVEARKSSTPVTDAEIDAVIAEAEAPSAKPSTPVTPTSNPADLGWKVGDTARFKSGNTWVTGEIRQIFDTKIGRRALMQFDNPDYGKPGEQMGPRVEQGVNLDKLSREAAAPKTPTASTPVTSRRKFEPLHTDSDLDARALKKVLGRVTATPKSARDIAEPLLKYEWRARSATERGDGMKRVTDALRTLVERDYVARYYSKGGDPLYVVAGTPKPAEMLTEAEISALEGGETPSATPVTPTTEAPSSTPVTAADERIPENRPYLKWSMKPSEMMTAYVEQTWGTFGQGDLIAAVVKAAWRKGFTPGRPNRRSAEKVTLGEQKRNVLRWMDWNDQQLAEHQRETSKAQTPVTPTAPATGSTPATPTSDASGAATMQTFGHDHMGRTWYINDIVQMEGGHEGKIVGFTGSQFRFKVETGGHYTTVAASELKKRIRHATRDEWPVAAGPYVFTDSGDQRDSAPSATPVTSSVKALEKDVAPKDGDHLAVARTREVLKTAIARDDLRYAKHIQSFLRALESGKPPQQTGNEAVYAIRGLEGAEFLWFNRKTNEPSARVRFLRDIDAAQDGRYYAAKIVEKYGEDKYRDLRFDDPRDQLKDGSVSLAFGADWNYVAVPTGENAPRAVDEPPAQPFTADSLQAAFNLTEEQAAATVALAKAMGLDTSRMEVVKGGTPSDGALRQGLFDDDDPPVDLLDTGEQQPRLPGAEDVREREVTTPEFDRNDEFRLTGEIVKRKAKQTTLFQGDAPFYSRLQRAVENATLKKASGQQWKATIRNTKGGISKDEYVFAHVDDLADATVYTKEEVLAYLKANELRVHPLTLGGAEDWEDDPRIKAAVEYLRERGFEIQEDEPGSDPYLSRDGEPVELEDESVPMDVVTRFAEVAEWAEKTSGPKFDQYVEPGADPDSYREVFLLMPPRPSGFDPSKVEIKRHRQSVTQGGTSIWYDGKKIIEYSDDPQPTADGRYEQKPDAHWMEVARSLYEKGDRINKVPSRSPNWSDGHSDYSGITNPIVRVRFNVRSQPRYDRTTVESIGHRVLDHNRQTTRNLKMITPYAVEKAVAAKVITPEEAAILANAEKLRGRDTTSAVDRVMFLEEVQPPTPDNQKRMPELLRKNWREIAFKWALRYAAENGLDAVAWTTGSMQADRYSLEKQVESIEWSPRLAGQPVRGVARVVFVKPKSGVPIQIHVDEDGLVVGGNHDGQRLVGKPLDEVIGKDIAKRVMAEYLGGTIEGEGLKIGGEGLKKLYDVDFPNVVKSLPAVKRTGAKVETAKVPVDRTAPSNNWIVRPVADMESRRGFRGNFVVEDRAADEWHDGFETQADAFAWAREQLAEAHLARVPAIAITPELRDAVMGGQALFQGAKGAVEFMVDGKALLRGLEAADVSTGVHEIAHVARRQLLDREVPPEQRAGITDDDIRTAEEWAGVEDGVWTVEAEEKFARGFERYLHDGDAPTSELKSLFAKFRDWLRRAYRRLLGSDIDVTISKAMKGVFDRLFTRSGGTPVSAAPAPKPTSATPVTAANAPRIGGYTRAALIDRIVQEMKARADKPSPVEAKEVRGTDGKWYRAKGNTMPWGVSPAVPHEYRSIGWVHMTRDSATVGKRYDSKEALIAAWDERREADAKELRQALEEKSDAELEASAKYWLPEQFDPDPYIREARERTDKDYYYSRLPIEDHDAFTDRIARGEVTPEELRAGWRRLLASSEHLRTEQLGKLTKDQLLKRLGGFSASRYKSEKKAAVVDAAWRAMVTDFHLGDTLSYSMGQHALERAVQAKVDAYTEADIADYAKRVAEARAKRAERIAGYKKALTNPETLEEFDLFARAQGESKLTPEQRAKYDELRAAAGRVQRAEADKQKSTVTAATETVGTKLVETKHTRDNYDLFVVQLEARVERSDYDRLNAAAKKLGGWYSSYRKAGAVPGFQFKTREAAETFQKFVTEGDTQSIQQAATERRETRREAKKNAAAERLAEMADKLEDAANEKLSADRLTNTARRPPPPRPAPTSRWRAHFAIWPRRSRVDRRRTSTASAPRRRWRRSATSPNARSTTRCGIGIPSIGTTRNTKTGRCRRATSTWCATPSSPRPEPNSSARRVPSRALGSPRGSRRWRSAPGRTRTSRCRGTSSPKRSPRMRIWGAVACSAGPGRRDRRRSGGWRRPGSPTCRPSAPRCVSSSSTGATGRRPIRSSSSNAPSPAPGRSATTSSPRRNRSRCGWPRRLTCRTGCACSSHPRARATSPTPCARWRLAPRSTSSNSPRRCARSSKRRAIPSSTATSWATGRGSCTTASS